MDNNKEPKKHKMFRKNEVRISSKGRSIKTPKDILTTSDDEPPIKKIKTSTSLGAKMDELKKLAGKLQLQKSKKFQGNSSTSRIDSKDSSDNTSQLHVSESRADKSNQQKNGHLTRDKSFVVDPDSNAEASSINTKILNVSESKAAQLNQLKIDNSSSEKNSFDGDDSRARASSDNTLLSQSYDTLNSAIFEKTYNKRLQENTIVFDANFLEGNNQIETFTNLPIINVPQGADGNLSSIYEKLQALKNKVDEITQKIEEIGKQNEEILQYFRSRFSTNQLEKNLYQHLEGFPMNTKEQFSNLDKQSNKQERQKMHDHLVRLGGTSFKEFLSCALRQMMTDELVLEYTWQKQKNSEKFGDTRVSNMLYQAAVNCSLFSGPENKAVYKEGMLGVLKATKQRCRNKLKKGKESNNLERRVDETIKNICDILGSEIENDSGSEADVEYEKESGSENEASDDEEENFN